MHDNISFVSLPALWVVDEFYLFIYFLIYLWSINDPVNSRDRHDDALVISDVR
jgi:hypothetical protein